MMAYGIRPEATAILIEKLLSKLELSDQDSFVISNLMSEYLYNIRLQTEILIRSNSKPEHQQRDVEQTLPIERIIRAYK